VLFPLRMNHDQDAVGFLGRNSLFHASLPSVVLSWLYFLLQSSLLNFLMSLASDLPAVHFLVGF
jgi:hypothetical protein